MDRGLLARLERASGSRIALLCALGLLISWAIVLPWKQRMWSGVQDITVLYAGAQMAGTGDLYNNAALQARERELVGVSSADFHYVRLPVVAAAYKLLTIVPYGVALRAWKVLTVAGFLAIPWILPAPRRLTYLAIAVSVAACSAVLLGQDVWLVALAAAACLHMMVKGRDGAAGVFLGLALLWKYHIFPLALLALLLQRKWRTIFAAAAVCLAGILISFAVQGASWPQDYARVLLAKGAVSAMYMPNAAGFVAMAGLGLRTYAAIFLLAALVIAAIARRSSTVFAFGIALFAGVLVAPHGYAYEYSVFIPALVPLAVEHPRLAPYCAYWLLPVPILPLVTGAPFAGQVLILLTGTATLLVAYRAVTPRR